MYISLIRQGFKDKTYGMPLFALGLNFAWEAIYACADLFGGNIGVQAYVNLIWMVLDAVIVYTYFKHGKENRQKSLVTNADYRIPEPNARFFGHAHSHHRRQHSAQLHFLGCAARWRHMG